MSAIKINRIKVISKRVFTNKGYNNNYKNCKHILNGLSEKVKEQQGFQKCSSYIELNNDTDNTTIHTISLWNNVNDWNTWYKSDYRRYLINYNDSEGFIKEEHIILNELPRSNYLF